jgi:hypothetical protein
MGVGHRRETLDRRAGPQQGAADDGCPLDEIAAPDLELLVLHVDWAPLNHSASLFSNLPSYAWSGAKPSAIRSRFFALSRNDAL